MTWEVVWSAKAIRQLKSLDKQTAVRIRDRVLEIRENPYRAVRRLVGVRLYSLRVGDHRVILNLVRGKMIVYVVSVSGRGRAYDRL